MHLPRQTCGAGLESVKQCIVNYLAEVQSLQLSAQPQPLGKLYSGLDAPCPNIDIDLLVYRSGVFTICFSAAMRSSSGGWVLNNEESVPFPNIGFTMQRAEVAGGIAVVGIRRLYAPSFSSALINPYGWPTIRAPVSSAAYSRVRDKNSCSSSAANGARKIINSAASPPPPRSSSRSLPTPPKIMAHFPICAMYVIAPAIVAATELTRMS